MPWWNSFFYWAPGWLFGILSLLFLVWAGATFFLPFFVWGIYRRTREIEREVRHLSLRLGQAQALLKTDLEARQEAGATNRDQDINL